MSIGNKNKNFNPSPGKIRMKNENSGRNYSFIQWAWIEGTVAWSKRKKKLRKQIERKRLWAIVD